MGGGTMEKRFGLVEVRRQVLTGVSRELCRVFGLKRVVAG